MADTLATAQRAVVLDPKSAVAQSALAVALGANLDFAGCLERSQLAYRLGPGDPAAVYQYCNALWCFGRVREGVEIIEQAVARDPLDPRTYVLRAKLLFSVNRTADSLASLWRAVALRPQFDGAHSSIGDTLVLTGRPAEAIPEYEKVSNAWDRLRGLAIARARMGDRAGSPVRRHSRVQALMKRLSFPV